MTVHHRPSPIVWFWSSSRTLWRGTSVANDTWTTTQLVEVLWMIQRFWTSQFSTQVCCILKSSKLVWFCHPVNSRRNKICRHSSSPSLLCDIYYYVWLHFLILYLSDSTIFGYLIQHGTAEEWADPCPRQWLYTSTILTSALQKKIYPRQRHPPIDERSSHIRIVSPWSNQ